MELTTWMLFSGIALVAVISPGPAVLLAVSNSLAHGFARSVWSSLGNIIGVFMVSGAAVLGLGALLQTSAFLFAVLKVLGALYLIYLGIRQWRSKNHVFDTAPEPNSNSRETRQSFFQGVLVALSNPKAILFFTALFPQFIDITRPLALQFIILTATFMIYSFMVLVMYAISVRSARDWFIKGNRARWFNRISGAVFIAFGIGILRLKNRTA